MSSASKPQTCGFCPTRDHELCKGTYRNGAAAPSGPTWNCACAESGHTMVGQPPRYIQVQRFDPSLLANLHPAPAVSIGTAPVTPPKPRKHLPQAEAGAAEAAGMVDRCVKCGWTFGHYQLKQTCGSERMCQRRQETGDPELGRPKHLRTQPAAA